MHMKSLSPSSFPPPLSSIRSAERPRVNPSRVLETLSARRALLSQRQVTLAALCDAGSSRVRSLSHPFVDARLLETARAIAEILELAERADEEARGGARQSRAMRALADVCFDAILHIDNARHELTATLDADATRQERQRDRALRCARRCLTDLERQLSRMLSD